MKVKMKPGPIIGILFAVIALVWVVLIFNQNVNIISYKEHQALLEAGYLKNVTLNVSEGKFRIVLTEKVKDDPKFNIETSFGEPVYILYADQFEKVLDEIIVYDKSRAISIYTVSNKFPMWMLYLLMIVGSIAFYFYLFKVKKDKKKDSQSKDFELISKMNLSFKDVAGLTKVKTELKEIVDFLKNRSKYNRLGAKLPSGVLLSGDPGTGKTLLAKAIAGEAEVSFISISGADFVEVFVGVGSARVRDLFKKAKENAPCIIFIDEIDALGRSRSFDGMGSSGSQERENTLNSLLVEMDGFTGKEGVIVIAATNRPDILDKALVRAGRFDRIIYTNKPDFESRKLIFDLHLKKLVVDRSIDLDRLSELTSGASGADIFNICNEAALLAGREQAEQVNIKHLLKALERQLGGINAGKILSTEEKKIVAIHESGHALCSFYLEHSPDIVKVSLIPRSGGLGYTQYKEKEGVLYSYEEILDQMTVSLGGRVAEEIVLGTVTTAASVDLEKVTNLARKIVYELGMSSNLVNQYFSGTKHNGSPVMYSDKTLEVIDNEIQAIVSLAYSRTKDLLLSKKDLLITFSKKLMVEEEVNYEQLKLFLDKS